jgi:hypothetical protein
MNVHPDRPKFMGRAGQRIAFIFDPDGNSIELMEIPPESAIYRERITQSTPLEQFKLFKGVQSAAPGYLNEHVFRSKIGTYFIQNVWSEFGSIEQD